MKKLFNVSMVMIGLLAVSACASVLDQQEVRSIEASREAVAAGRAGQDSPAPESENKDFVTGVVGRDAAAPDFADWGTFYAYFQGQSADTKNVLAGVAEIKPGEEIHPPHAHAEEEFLIVTQGSGEWTIGEEVFPANTGDMLYAKPWDLHGLKNTGETTLAFVVWKWQKKAPLQNNAE